MNEQGETRRPKLFDRRSFLDWCLGLIVTLPVIGTIYPVLKYILGANKLGGKESFGLLEIPLEEVEVGNAVIRKFRNKPVIVIRNSETNVYALSAVCTHLGCVVKWDQDTRQILCPCHSAIFDVRGNVIGGPAPSPLQVFDIKISGKKLIIGSST
ncbi:ubiquinol-cytochrome c reductase iron-sulfur subunit [bacterium]|nr:ubiquinol-cytochrome c reductase iron-sulfur subunit [bacterium]